MSVSEFDSTTRWASSRCDTECTGTDTLFIMRVAILSDIHDNIWNLRAALDHVADCDALICCGDLCSPFIVDQLKRFPKHVHIVFGNNDADQFRITLKCDARIHAYGELFAPRAEVFGGREVAVNHFDYIAESIVRSEMYDFVCYGHNHRIRAWRFGRTLAVNPGTIMGAAFDRGYEDVPATFAIWETAANSIEAFALNSDRRVKPFPLEIELLKPFQMSGQRS